MKSYRASIQLFRYNFSSILLFEILYKIIALAVLGPVIYGLLNYSVEAAGMQYLSTRTMAKYFCSPSTYVFLFCILIVLAIYFLINISALIYAMESSYRSEKTNAVALLLKGFFNALRVIHPKNMGMLVYVLFILPFTYTVMITGSLIGVKVPEFFNQFLSRHHGLLIVILALYIILCIFSMFRIYSLNYYTLYKLNYRESVRMSRGIIRRHVFKVLFGTMFFNLLITGILLMLEGVLTSIFAGIFSNIISYKELNFAVSIFIEIVFVVLYLVFSMLSTPMIYAFICNEFYILEGDPEYAEFQEVVKRREIQDKDADPKKLKKKNRIVTALVLTAGLALNGFYLYLSLSNKVNLNIVYPTRAAVTAHRGDSENAPENTMAAFSLAVENQADIIELDVRQTGDGIYIIMHDENLYRTVGVDYKVGEVTYEFIEQLDAGSKFSEEYAGEHIPTLEEVLLFAKEQEIFLNIELKPAKTDQNYVQGIVDMLNEYDFLEQCVVASADYDVLAEIKQINSDIRTVYIMNMAFGEFGDMQDVDIFSIKHSFISANMVRDIHKNGKEVYAWTVNSESDIKKLLLLDVDSIITDNPYETKDIIYNANDTLLSDWLQRLVKEY